MKIKKYTPLQVFAIFLCGLLAGKFCFSTTKEGIGISLFNGKPSKLQSVINLIDNRYVDKIDIDSLTELIIPDIFLKLDPHTKYVPYENRNYSEKNIRGQFCGIGIEYSFMNDSLLVVYTMKDSPCEKAGILPGDNIVKADTVEINSLSNKNSVSTILSGEKNSEVKLYVKRQGVDSLLVFNIKRDDIPILSIPAGYQTDSLTGYIKITSFGEKTYNEFLQKTKDLKEKGIQNLIIDLRDNGGGLLYTARDIASEILNTGDTIVYTVKRENEIEYTITDTVSHPLCKDLKIICLVNYFTASASEIMSGAIQDNDRGLILGRRTFGKGLVQTPIALSDNSLIKLTTSRYYTPSGRSFQKKYQGYATDYATRIKKGEFDSANAYTFDTTKVFRTKNGRKVYQGGGVMPDFFIGADKRFTNGILYKLDSCALFSKFTARKYGAMFQKDSSQTKNFFVEKLFENEQKLLDEFFNFASLINIKIDVKKDKKEILAIKQDVLNQIKACAYYIMCDYDNYYKYLNSGNPDLDSAESLFNDFSRFESLLKP